MGPHSVTNVELQSQITGLDKKVDERHENNQKLLGDLATKMDTLIELNLGQKLQGQMLGQMSTRMEKHDEHFEEIFPRLGKVESINVWHGRVWKAVGLILLASLGSVGWLLVQMKDYYHLEYRVDTLEFLVQGRNVPVPPPAAQTSSGPK